MVGHMRAFGAQFLIPVLGVVCLFPFMHAAMALVLGMGAALVFGNPHHAKTTIMAKKLLALCVIGLGAGMNLMVVADAGLRGIGYTGISILMVLGAGVALGRLVKTDGQTSFLIAAGTAICGGSAIAAMAPVIHARAASISIAMGVVFALNALALFLFPGIGHYFGLSQHEFGLWSALAIHDTSSVVGAGMIYGADALEIATTVKLARALWIVPLVFAVGFFMHHRRQNEDAGVVITHRYPWFILGFLMMAALVTWVPELQEAGNVVERIARQGLVLCLFLIGANLTRETIRAVGVRPLVQGVVLWSVTAMISLAVIKMGWIGV